MYTQVFVLAGEKYLKVFSSLFWQAHAFQLHNVFVFPRTNLFYPSWGDSFAFPLVSTISIILFCLDGSFFPPNFYKDLNEEKKQQIRHFLANSTVETDVQRFLLEVVSLSDVQGVDVCWKEVVSALVAWFQNKVSKSSSAVQFVYLWFFRVFFTLTLKTFSFFWCPRDLKQTNRHHVMILTVW